MKKTGNGPFRCAVTLCAILAEQLKVRISVGVAARAIQRHLLPADVWTRAFWAIVLSNPRSDLIAGLALLAVRTLLGKFMQSDIHQRSVIHLGQSTDSALMLKMTFPAALDMRVESGWLQSEQRFIVSVAGDAIRRLDSLYRRVAGGAIVFEECMRG